MGTVQERAGEKNRRGLAACSLHGEYLEHNPEIWHSVRDKIGVESAHRARSNRKNEVALRRVHLCEITPLKRPGKS